MEIIIFLNLIKNDYFQMLNKSQQDENILRNNSQQSHMPLNHPPQIPPELVVKLHQVQQQQV